MSDFSDSSEDEEVEKIELGSSSEATKADEVAAAVDSTKVLKIVMLFSYCKCLYGVCTCWLI